MAQFFRNSRVWAVEFQYDGRTRRWLKALPLQADAHRVLRDLLDDLYGDRARLVAVRPATDLEDQEFLRGNMPRNAFCPTGKAPVSEVRPSLPGPPAVAASKKAR
jgi:hypothetical protein